MADEQTVVVQGNEPQTQSVAEDTALQDLPYEDDGGVAEIFAAAEKLIPEQQKSDAPVASAEPKAAAQPVEPVTQTLDPELVKAAKYYGFNEATIAAMDADELQDRIAVRAMRTMRAMGINPLQPQQAQPAQQSVAEPAKPNPLDDLKLELNKDDTDEGIGKSFDTVTAYVNTLKNEILQLRQSQASLTTEQQRIGATALQARELQAAQSFDELAGSMPEQVKNRLGRATQAIAQPGTQQWQTWNRIATRMAVETQVRQQMQEPIDLQAMFGEAVRAIMPDAFNGQSTNGTNAPTASAQARNGQLANAAPRRSPNEKSFGRHAAILAAKQEMEQLGVDPWEGMGALLAEAET